MTNLIRPNSTHRVLTIQSHVVSGYCGNKSATFPLQLLGFEVDVINSVQLSNHTQYKVTKGQIFNSDDLKEIYLGLKANNLLSLYNVVLSGYVADVGYIKCMAEMIKDTKEQRRNLGLSCMFTLDPVLGDDGPGYYVPNGADIAEAYKQNLLQLADIVTPNRFEATKLTGYKIEPSSKNALKQTKLAIDAFHEKGVKIVALTSLVLDSNKNEILSILSYNPKSTLLDENGDGTDNLKQQQQLWHICLPKLDCPFTGTGDLFTALLSAWLDKTNFNIQQSFENTANTIYTILEDTMAWYKQFDNGSIQDIELRLVQNKTAIMSPVIRFTAKPMEI